MESDVRFFRRRANEELAAASRAVTDAARARRMVLAEAFLQRLKAVEAAATATELAIGMGADRPAMNWERRA
jgi:hypothetical protein